MLRFPPGSGPAYPPHGTPANSAPRFLGHEGRVSSLLPHAQYGEQYGPPPPSPSSQLAAQPPYGQPQHEEPQYGQPQQGSSDDGYAAQGWSNQTRYEQPQYAPQQPSCRPYQAHQFQPQPTRPSYFTPVGAGHVFEEGEFDPNQFTAHPVQQDRQLVPQSYGAQEQGFDAPAYDPSGTHIGLAQHFTQSYDSSQQGGPSHPSAQAPFTHTLGGPGHAVQYNAEGTFFPRARPTAPNPSARLSSFDAAAARLGHVGAGGVAAEIAQIAFMGKMPPKPLVKAAGVGVGIGFKPTAEGHFKFMHKVSGDGPLQDHVWVDLRTKLGGDVAIAMGGGMGDVAVGAYWSSGGSTERVCTRMLTPAEAVDAADYRHDKIKSRAMHGQVKSPFKMPVMEDPSTHRDGDNLHDVVTLRNTVGLVAGGLRNKASISGTLEVITERRTAKVGQYMLLGIKPRTIKDVSGAVGSSMAYSGQISHTTSHAVETVMIFDTTVPAAMDVYKKALKGDLPTGHLAEEELATAVAVHAPKMIDGVELTSVEAIDTSKNTAAIKGPLGQLGFAFSKEDERRTFSNADGTVSTQTRERMKKVGFPGYGKTSTGVALACRYFEPADTRSAPELLGFDIGVTLMASGAKLNNRGDMVQKLNAMSAELYIPSFDRHDAKDAYSVTVSRTLHAENMNALTSMPAAAIRKCEEETGCRPGEFAALLRELRGATAGASPSLMAHKPDESRPDWGQVALLANAEDAVGDASNPAAARAKAQADLLRKKAKGEVLHALVYALGGLEEMDMEIHAAAIETAIKKVDDFALTHMSLAERATHPDDPRHAISHSDEPKVVVKRYEESLKARIAVLHGFAALAKDGLYATARPDDLLDRRRELESAFRRLDALNDLGNLGEPHSMGVPERLALYSNEDIYRALPPEEKAHALMLLASNGRTVRDFDAKVTRVCEELFVIDAQLIHEERPDALPLNSGYATPYSDLSNAYGSVMSFQQYDQRGYGFPQDQYNQSAPQYAVPHRAYPDQAPLYASTSNEKPTLDLPTDLLRDIRAMQDAAREALEVAKQKIASRPRATEYSRFEGLAPPRQLGSALTPTTSYASASQSPLQSPSGDPSLAVAPQHRAAQYGPYRPDQQPYAEYSNQAAYGGGPVDCNSYYGNGYAPDYNGYAVTQYTNQPCQEPYPSPHRNQGYGDSGGQQHQQLLLLLLPLHQRMSARTSTSASASALGKPALGNGVASLAAFDVHIVIDDIADDMRLRRVQDEVEDALHGILDAAGDHDTDGFEVSFASEVMQGMHPRRLETSSDIRPLVKALESNVEVIRHRKPKEKSDPKLGNVAHCVVDEFARTMTPDGKGLAIVLISPGAMSDEETLVDAMQRGDEALDAAGRKDAELCLGMFRVGDGKMKAAKIDGKREQTTGKDGANTAENLDVHSAVGHKIENSNDDLPARDRAAPLFHGMLDPRIDKMNDRSKATLKRREVTTATRDAAKSAKRKVKSKVKSIFGR